MNRKKNEQGYALISVLLIVTVFTIIFLSFMGQAFSSVKQNQVAEKRTRTVAAAEMGISYYQVAIQNMFKSKQTEVTNYVRSIMENETTDPDTVDFKREATEEMATQLQNMIPSATGIPIESIKNMIGTETEPIEVDEHPNASFYIKDFKANAIDATSVTPYRINISFNVVGTKDGQDTTLSTKMYIDLNTILNIPTSENPAHYDSPTYNNIPKPEGSQCTDFSTCSPVFITEPGKGVYDGNNFIRDNLTIYSTEGLTFTGMGNENNNSNINIHAEKDIIVGQNMNSQTKLTIEANNNATFQQNLKIDTESNLLVRLKLIVNSLLTVINKSFVYVGGDAKVNDLSISGTSKMCVQGDLYTDKKPTVGSNSKLLVHGRIMQLNNSDKNYYEIEGGHKDINEFKSECGTYVPPSFQINWGDTINPVISDVEY